MNGWRYQTRTDNLGSKNLRVANYTNLQGATTKNYKEDCSQFL